MNARELRKMLKKPDASLKLTGAEAGMSQWRSTGKRLSFRCMARPRNLVPGLWTRFWKTLGWS